MFSSDVVVKEVATPFGLWCSSGHVAATKWAREGAGTKSAPMRFFQVSSVKHSVGGTYCEPCLTIANEMARRKKIKKDE